MNLASKSLSLLAVAAFVGLGALGHSQNAPLETTLLIVEREVNDEASSVSYFAAKSHAPIRIDLDRTETPASLAPPELSASV